MERVTEWKIERRFLILKRDKKLPKINYEKLLVFYLQITGGKRRHQGGDDDGFFRRCQHAKFHTIKEERRALAERMKDPNDELKLVIVRDMWITGFDVPCLHTETTIRQVIDNALVSDKVVDIFDAAGIKKPDISILSEEFLMELKGMEHKNIAIEVLRKLLNDEIKSRAKTYLVESRSLMEMLENSLTNYHNKVLSAAEVIEELINLSKQIVEQDKKAKEMGLSDYEYAFYTAAANNESPVELMGKDRLCELAGVLTDIIRNNTTIDWTIKENVRAKMKVAVKRLLRRYGYPPDMQQLATETVLKQAEMIAEELTHM